MIQLFKNSKINFISKFKISAISSLIFIFCGILFFFLKGMEFGIDFQSGSSLIIKHSDSTNIKQEFEDFLNSNNYNYLKISKYDDTRIKITFDSSNPIDETLFKKQIESNMGTEYKVDEYRKLSAKITNKLKNNAIQALLIAVLLIGFYIIIRFDWYSAIGGITALIHDSLITISLLIFFSYQFDMNIVAALLLIIGYSLNDTIVVFDRMRENIKEYSNMELGELVNLSLNETLNRTIITSLTTLFVITSLFIFGGGSLANLSFALMIGVISGTYSSIFIAVPIMMFLRNKYYKEDSEKEETWQ